MKMKRSFQPPMFWVTRGHEYSFPLGVPTQELSVLKENETIVSTADVLGDEGDTNILSLLAYPHRS